MRPVNFLRYYLYRYFQTEKVGMERYPISYRPLLWKRQSHKICWIENLKYLISSPLYVIDRFLMPIYERYQIISKTVWNCNLCCEETLTLDKAGKQYWDNAWRT